MPSVKPRVSDIDEAFSQSDKPFGATSILKFQDKNYVMPRTWYIESILCCKKR